MNAPPKLLSAAVLVLCALPYAAGFLAAPRGSVFLGALNNLGDTGQYLAAIRQGTEGRLLYVNAYTSAAVAPALIYPLYTAAGLLTAPLRLSPPVVYLALHAVAALLLLVALWRLCRIASPLRPRLAFAVALLGGGLYFPVLLLSGVLSLPFAPVVLTAPELSLFATVLISPHGALGLAAELWAFASYMLWRRHGRTDHLAHLAVAGLALGLCYPFGVAVLLAVVGVDAALRYILPDWRLPATQVAWQRPATKVAQGIDAPQDTSVSVLCHATWVTGRAQDSRLVLALVPTVALALYYAALFHAPPWGASNMTHLPLPDIAVLAAAFGPLLLAALPAVLARRPATAVAWQIVMSLRDAPTHENPRFTQQSSMAAAAATPADENSLFSSQSPMAAAAATPADEKGSFSYQRTDTAVSGRGSGRSVYAATGHTRPQSARRLPCDRGRRPVDTAVSVVCHATAVAGPLYTATGSGADSTLASLMMARGWATAWTRSGRPHSWMKPSAALCANRSPLP